MDITDKDIAGHLASEYEQLFTSTPSSLLEYTSLQK